MPNPKIAGRFFGGRESKPVGSQIVREAGRVKVEPVEFLRFCPIDPPFEMLGQDFIARNLFSLVFEIDGMQIKAVLSRNQRERLFGILAQFIGSTGFPRIVPGRKNSPARQTGSRLESANVIPLPAMQRNRHRRNFFQRGINIDADFGIALFRQLKSLLDFVHFKLL